MRKHHYTPPSKWLKEFRRALSLGRDHLLVYTYLESGLESHATGLYHILPAALGGMIRLEADAVEQILEELQKAGLILWDDAEGIVYIPCVCEEQFRWTGRDWKRTDNRVVEGRAHVRELPDSWVKKAFLERWEIFTEEGACKGLGSPSEGAPTSTTTTTTNPLSPDRQEQPRDFGRNQHQTEAARSHREAVGDEVS
jgi:hypothetical protein